MRRKRNRAARRQRKKVSHQAAAADATALAALVPQREFGIDSMASVSVSGNKALFQPGSLRVL